MSDFKVAENRLRRVAARQGYKLNKIRARDPRTLYYGCYYIVKADSNVAINSHPVPLDVVARDLGNDPVQILNRNYLNPPVYVVVYDQDDQEIEEAYPTKEEAVKAAEAAAVKLPDPIIIDMT